ncbi:aminotransferase class IV [Amycolatopsis anabasis]|uniref:aminotransferase class IV n=1 Tax=Amycolatopsis anabasis TaxID=1840409 RepID=UPI00131E42E9|nr:aminotransferase class IV [Amycolatopsis anabasis]
MTSGFERGAAFVEGEYVPIAEARIPLVDVGFTRSDVTYDVVAVWDGAFFRLEDHLERFERGCARLRLRSPHDRAATTKILLDLVRMSGLREAYVEVICTRGMSRGGSRDPRDFDNRFYAYAIPYVWILRPEDPATGMDAVIARTVRRIPGDSVDPTVKNYQWGDFTRGLYEAYERGGRYPILLDQAGNITEGAGYNLFAVVGERLLTPASGTLEGITRRTVLELAAEAGIRAEAVDLDEDLFRTAREIFATSTAGGVMPVTSLDGEPIGDGRAGPMTTLLRERYWRAHREPRYRTPVDY